MQVEHPDFTITTYVYDADGHRVEKDDGVDVVRFVYDGNNVVQERDDLGIVDAAFTYIPAAYAHVVSQYRDPASSFYHFDGTNNVTQLRSRKEVQKGFINVPVERISPMLRVPVKLFYQWPPASDTIHQGDANSLRCFFLIAALWAD